MVKSWCSGGSVALSLVMLAACDSDFRPYNEIHGFRVLAITAEPPELVRDGRVQLRVLAVGDPGATFSWSWCPVTLGPSSSHACAFADDEIPEGLPRAFLGTSTTTEIAWTGSDAAHDMLCDESALRAAPSGAPRYDCSSPRPQIFIRLEATSSTGERIVALKELPLRSIDASANQIPHAMGLGWKDGEGYRPLDEGSVLTSGAEISLEIDISENESETWLDGSTVQEEILRATWFVEGGETDIERTVFIPGDDTATFDALRTNTWTLPTGVDRAVLYLVVRDDRGGTSWISRTVELDEGEVP